MPVDKVYWFFDTMAAYIRLTNPYGSDGDGSSTASPHEAKRVMHDSGLSFANAMYSRGLKVERGATVYESVAQAGAKDPHLADFIGDLDSILG